MQNFSIFIEDLKFRTCQLFFREIENAAVKVRLFLRDDLTKKELAGAKLQILWTGEPT